MVASLEPPRGRGVPAGIVVLVSAVVWWVVGFLPWIVTGLNGSESGIMPETEWTAAVPLSAYGAGWLFNSGLIGGVCASAVWTLARPQTQPVWVMSLGGIGIAAVAALAQSGIAAASELDLGSRDYWVFVILATACIWGSFAGWVLGVLLALGSPWFGLGLSVAVSVGLSWYGTLLAWYVDSMGGGRASMESGGTAYELMRWQWVGVFAVALFVIGARPVQRLLLWPVAVVVSWFAYLPGTIAWVLSRAVFFEDSSELGELLWYEPTTQDVIDYSVALALAGLATLALAYWRWRQPGVRSDNRSSAPEKLSVG
ncbi:MAG: hypothetical protein L0K86_17620 [Actinomycetia bacterium]|nr:hypothetical protein [Actinomycetes bacterium]